jgi:hypothetical protein
MVAAVIDPQDLINQEVLLWDGNATQLGRLWADGPLVLVFLRHYG